MADFTAIWVYVEREMKVEIPPYIKHILMHCGYENYHTISTIEESDIEYFENEVRNGKIPSFSNCATEKKGIVGFSNESAENFEFIRGHKNLILAVVKFIKEKVNDYGVGIFSAKSITKLAKNESLALKTVKEFKNDVKNSKTDATEDVTSERILKKNVIFDSARITNSPQNIFFVHEEIIKHTSDLLTTVLSSLSIHTRSLYLKNIDIIGRKISTDLVQVHANLLEKFSYFGKVKCPYCSNYIPVIYKKSLNQNETWNVVDFVHHLKSIHEEESKRGEGEFKADQEADSTLASIVSVDLKVNTVMAFSTDSNNHADEVDKEEKCKEICIVKNLPTNLDQLKFEELEITENPEWPTDNASFHQVLEDAGRQQNNESNRCYSNLKEGDYVICLLKEESAEWPSMVPVEKHFVSQILSIEGTIRLQILKKKDFTKVVFIGQDDCNIRTVSEEEILTILEVPIQNRRNHLVFKDKAMSKYEPEFDFVQLKIQLFPSKKNIDTTMADFTAIWVYVEREMKVEIPPYIKHILMHCGYENYHTISTIEESDIEYFENEVRNGKIPSFSNCATEKKGIVGFSSESAENFEFIRGHKNLILAVVKFIKEKLNENGVASFPIPTPKSIVRKRVADQAAFNPNQKSKISKTSTREYSIQNQIPQNSESEAEPSIILKEHRSIILRKMILSLATLTPENFSNNYESLTEEKPLFDLIHVEVIPSESTNQLVQYKATINCTYCRKLINVSHSSNGEKGKPWWNMSNYNAHLEVHAKTVMSKSEKNLKCSRLAIQNERRSVIYGEEMKSCIQCPTQNSNVMLKAFVESAERNSDKKKQGYRFDDMTKMFSSYMFMLSGRLAYETLNANLPLSIPSVSTVSRFLKDNGPTVIEGQMRTDELLTYLRSRNLPLRICISEDATRITAKVLYDPNTNQLVGFALPLNENGMPITFSFPARTFKEIHKHFTNPSNFISSSAYVQMAKPLEPNAPSFCLMLFLTDNTFTARNTLNRWRFQAQQLKEKNIIIENIATDGDSRPLKVMKYLSKIGQDDGLYFDSEYFSCGGEVETTFTQDTTHILTKARNAILRCSRIFPIGNKIISSSHLKYLIANISKDKHLLTLTDVEPKDRQNFLSAKKICSKNTTRCLLEYVPGCEGTVMYLNAIRNVSTAFMDYNIKSADRIYLIWYSTFFFRGWRSWLINSEKKDATNKKSKRIYDLKENFISSNLYTCIELNAHALVKKIIIQDTPRNVVSDVTSSRNQTFFPDLFGSQPCESIFRQVRSFTSTFSTVVNFSMFDIIHRIKKIQLQSDIIATLKSKIKFPRFEKKDALIEESKENFQFEGLNQHEIKRRIEKARDDVIQHLKDFGIDTSKLNFHCQVKPVFEKDMEDSGDIDSDEDIEYDEDQIADEASECVNIEQKRMEYRLHADASEGDLEDLEKDLETLSELTGDLQLKDYSEVHDADAILISENSPFVVVVGKNSKEIVVRKSSICWLLSKDKFKLSSDRLQRVKEKEYSVNTSEKQEIIPSDGYSVRNEISIGEWCIFSQKEYKCMFPQREDEELNMLVGMVLGFTYLDGQTFKQREFSKCSAAIKENSGKNSENGVGVLCTLYTCCSDGGLKNVPSDKHKFMKISSYVGTINPPIYADKKINIPKKLFDILTEVNI